MQTTNSHWTMGLVQTMKDSKNLIINTDLACVIKDKFPKARYHFLVLPWENIPSIYHLNKSHLTLLNELEMLAKNVIEISSDCSESDFQIGYHTVPSMQRLHLHVVSTDFNSSYLKNKKHYNSFTTDFFLPVHIIHDQVRNDGKVKRIPESMAKEWLSTELRCFHCDLRPKNMPTLKDHLRTHDNKSQ